MIKTFFETLDRTGFIIPTWVFILIFIGFIIYLFIKYLMPKIIQFDKAKNNIDSIDNLKATIQGVAEKSKTKDKELSDRLDNFDAKLQELTSMLSIMQSKADLQERNQLKDKIREYYTYYHEVGCWNKMEKESLEGLIESYESAGGENSFVHSIVQPEMYTWTIID